MEILTRFIFYCVAISLFNISTRLWSCHISTLSLVCRCANPRLGYSVIKLRSMQSRWHESKGVGQWRGIPASVLPQPTAGRDALFRLECWGGYTLSKDFYKPHWDTLDKLDRFRVATPWYLPSNLKTSKSFTCSTDKSLSQAFFQFQV